MKTSFLAIAVALVLGCNHTEDLERAKQLIAQQQWANARTALGQQIKLTPDDRASRALLLYCLDREDGLHQITNWALYGLYQLAMSHELPWWERQSSELHKFFDDQLIGVRKSLFDKGVDSKDGQELGALLLEMARYGFAHDESNERKDVEAALVARTGDRAARDHLLSRLKSNDSSAAAAFLVDLGLYDPSVATQLRAVIADRSSLGRRPAIEALALIAASASAHAMLDKHPSLMALRASVPGQPRLPNSVLRTDFALELARVHAHYLALDGQPEDAVVMLQSWDDQRATVIVETYAVRSDRFEPLRVADRSGAAVDLGGTSAVFDLVAAKGVIQLKRIVNQTRDIEIDAGPLARPAPGMRVRLRGYEPHGEIVREDRGLWIVRVDAPIAGMTELSVPTNALLALRHDKRVETNVETFLAKIRPNALEIVARDSKPDVALADTNIPRSTR